MMRLTTNNIENVTELTYNGKTYGWFVSMKSGYVSDSREYINYVDGKTTNEMEFKKEWLPKAVQKFIEIHRPELTEVNGDFAHYIYK